MIGKLKDLYRTRDGEWVVSFATRVDPRPLFDELHEKDVSVEIKKASRRRTKTANDFLWAMCTDIGNALNPPIPKEEVYRNAVWETRDKIHAFQTMHMREEAIETFKRIWAQNGTAWFVEVIDYSPFPGCKSVLAFYGSSRFDSGQMSILIDYLKQDMTNMGLMIPVSKEEEERLLSQWGKAFCKTSGSATSAEDSTALKSTTSSPV